MAYENVAKFEELVRGDSGLQAKLNELVESFEGDKADERAFFEATVAKVAAGAGLPFTFEEATEQASSGHELSDDELDAVAGGVGWCLILGAADRVEVGCENYEGHACAYIGISGSLGLV